jgi:hypothetical protein
VSRRMTPFERDLDQWSSDPTFQEEYQRTRAEVAAVDELVRGLDAHRARLGVSKAGLARLTRSEPSVIRRLLTTSDPNPQLATFVEVASALGLRLVLEPAAGLAPVSGARLEAGTQRRNSKRRELDLTPA